MMRFKTEEEFQAMLKRSNAKVAAPLIVRPLDGEGMRVQTPKAKVPKLAHTSEIEELFAVQIKLASLPDPQREYHFLRGRAHRLDFAWPDHRVNGMQLGVEVQGMPHRIKERFVRDLEKRALGLLQGWLILEVGGDQVRDGKGIEWLRELFKKATSEGDNDG